MQQETEKMQLFYEYYRQWIDVYKKGAISDATALCTKAQN